MQQNMNKSIGFYLRAIVSLGIISYLITILEWDRIYKILPSLVPEYVMASYILVLFSTGVAAIRWSFLLKQVAVIQRIRDSLNFYLTSMFYGAILPGIVAGDLVRLGLSIKLHGLASKGVLAVGVLIERACGLMSVLIIFSVMTLSLPPIIAKAELFSASANSVSIFLIISFVLMLVILKALPGLWRVKSAPSESLIARIYLILDGLRNLPVAVIFSILLLSILVNLFDIVAGYFLAQALHLDVSLYVFLLIIPMTYVLTALPISLGGLGVREGVLTFFLVKVGVVASDAVVLALLIYLTKLAVGLIGGLIHFTGPKQHPQTGAGD
ncbi:MAG: flippase-like domain-containing protein [Gammaproteobacteria bacterium]|nr:flippase-like domain-containing protein [Gammaproteobacteria bacterium]